MSQRDLSKMTLADMEALASRLEAAARTIRESLEIVSPRQTQPSQAPRAGLPTSTSGAGDGGEAGHRSQPGALLQPPAPPPVAEGSADLDTEERREFRQEKAKLSEAAEERKAEHKAYLESVRGRKQALLSQFAQDGGPMKTDGGDNVSLTYRESLTNVSGS